MAILNLTVAASLDDAYERESNGVVDPTGTEIRNDSNFNVWSRYWGGYRYVVGGPGIPVGSTIIAAYQEFYVLYAVQDDTNFDIHFEKLAGPAAFTTGGFSITGRTRTTLSTPWVADGVGTGYQGAAISLVAPLQEVVNLYTVTAIVVITRPNQDADKVFSVEAEDHAGNHPAKLHVEYILPYTPRHGFVNFQVPGIV